ncbi:carbohydrate kinase family protein [Gloeocapsa sp. PCC 73106]|uniref:carbohydrate kinase family protein n=1 Tax=Gloeocapsa sp. PCC 73106 TaxID=102232 RepID=UPI0002AC4B39|nr:carbohydrate kinase family protein [Gloeocapsa sp. PCC 73106]ELR99897.1 sugar kinase, ribokinase [Gloeocapsa sp. PCC 73106]
MENLACILVVGGANGEYLLELLENFEVGQKNLVDTQNLIGGGGVNYTLRLLNMGYPALPILPLGDDELGKKIQTELVIESQKVLRKTEVKDFISSPLFLDSQITTQLSTIAIQGDSRTIFTEKPLGVETFKEHIEKQLNSVVKPLLIECIVICDIHADNGDLYPDNQGKCTEYLINSFQDNAFIYANFGRSQINLGYQFWQPMLAKLSILQLNIKELKTLFGADYQSLALTVETLIKDKINALITLDKFGSIGVYWREPTRIIFAHPYPLNEVRDTTGAGDAFGAGIVSQLYTKRNFSWLDFYDAIAEARVWSAYACTQLGGGANCPNPEELYQMFTPNNLGMEVRNQDSIRTILDLLDKIYE